MVCLDRGTSIVTFFRKSIEPKWFCRSVGKGQVEKQSMGSNSGTQVPLRTPAPPRRFCGLGIARDTKLLVYLTRHGMIPPIFHTLQNSIACQTYGYRIAGRIGGCRFSLPISTYTRADAHWLMRLVIEGISGVIGGPWHWPTGTAARETPNKRATSADQ